MAITLVSLAVGLGLYLQVGLGLLNAALIAMAFYVGLICAHILVRRSEAIRTLRQEVDRLENEVKRLARVASQQQPMDSAQQLPFPYQSPAPVEGASGSRPQQLLAAGAPARRGAAPPAPQMQGRPAASNHIPPRAQHPAKPQAAAAGVSHRSSGGQPSGAREGDPVSGFWSVRPTDVAPSKQEDPASGTIPAPRVPVRHGVSANTTAAPAGPSQSARAAVQQPRPSDSKSDDLPAAAGRAGQDDLEGAGVEGDVEVIQDMIRMFSEEIAQPRKPTSSSDEIADDHGGSDEAAEADEAAISASVDALRAAAEEMRRPAEGGRASIEKGMLPPLRVDPHSSTPQPPPVGPEHEDMAEMADAIATGKLDVFLEPIVGLADRKARHFDVSLRLRNGDGGSFGPEDYIPMARNAGLLPQADATRAARAAMVARHMDERGSGGCLFSSITAESLTSPRFLEEFAEACRQSPKLRERLVFSIAHSELQGLSTAQWSTIRKLATSGFRFAIEDVTSLDLDLPDLKAAGFTFMRINAQSMLDGLASLEGVLPLSELCQRISAIGLTLIAVGLGGEDQLEGVLAAGVPLGQGQLFGVPRPIRAEALRPAASSAAA